MLFYNFFDNISHSYKNCVVALGTFDGIHTGHQHIIRRTVKLARETGGMSVVLTFSNHPLSVIASEQCPLLIISNQEKIRLLRDLNVDIVFNIPFDLQLAMLSAHDFIALLLERLNPRQIVVGENYSFGRGGRGTPFTLLEAGLRVEVHEALVVKGVVTSSTEIRRLIIAGEISAATILLGRPPAVHGIVQPSRQVGRTLGFPTANVAIPDDHIAPGDGIYAANAIVAGKVYQAVVNIGNNPTFGGIDRRIEVHIFDFNSNLYGKEITVFFREFIRGVIKFDSKEQLIDQIHIDVLMARSILNHCCWCREWLML